MLQPNPSGLPFRSFEPTLFPAAGDAGDPGSPFAPAGGRAPQAARGDAIAPPWFRSATPVDPPLPGTWGFGGPGGSQAGPIYGLIASLIGAVQQLVASLFGSQPGGGQPGPQRMFRDVDLSSTGDPHLAAVGTRAGPGGDRPVDDHFDSMVSHHDLLDSADVAGGYRVSTRVGAPDAHGVTTNDSATVHANFGQDAVRMHADGSFEILDGGDAVALGKGQTVTLSGGETVRENDDGSLLVSAATAGGGSIGTTLRAVGGRVDVTTHAHQIALGGDIVDHAVPEPRWAARA